MSSHDRSLYLRYADGLRHPGDFSAAVSGFFSSDANINVVHPFNELQGADAYLSMFVAPLQQAFVGLYRRDDIFNLCPGSSRERTG